MSPIPWYYIWSPKYEVFHHILNTCIDMPNLFTNKNNFFRQEDFESLYTPGQHFFAGNYLKFDFILNVLENTLDNQHLILSDADLVVDNVKELYNYLQNFLDYDLVGMKDDLTTNTINIGVLFLKNSSKLRNFIKILRDEIKSTGKQDQQLLNKNIINSDLKYSLFDVPQMSQSNFGIDNVMKSFITQLLCSGDNYEDNLFEKLITASCLIDITPLRTLIPLKVYNSLIDFHKYHKTNLPIMFS